MEPMGTMLQIMATKQQNKIHISSLLSKVLLRQKKDSVQA